MEIKPRSVKGGSARRSPGNAPKALFFKHSMKMETFKGLAGFSIARHKDKKAK